MAAEYAIPLSKIEKEFALERIVIPENYDEIKVENREVNRPGLALTGFYEIFEKSRISLIGNAEHRYLLRLEDEDRKKKIQDYIDAQPIAVIFTGIFMAMLDIVGQNLTGYTAYNEYITDVIISVIVYLSAFSLVIQTMLPKFKKANAANANAETVSIQNAETEEGGENV